MAIIFLLPESLGKHINMYNIVSVRLFRFHNEVLDACAENTHC